MDFDFETLNTLLDCDIHSGSLLWKTRPASLFLGGKYDADRLAHWWNSQWAGKAAIANINDKGYKVGTIFGKRAFAHRVVFTFATGRPPTNEIDHINGIRSDNRFSNLRDVSNVENGRNRTISTRNSSGVNGVHFHKKSGKWAAKIGDKGQSVWLGEFDVLEDAIAARQAAERKLGYHEGHGKMSGGIFR